MSPSAPPRVRPPHLHEPLRVGPVEAGLLRSALFLYAEYLERLAVEAEAADEEAVPDMRAVLDLLAEELGTEIVTTLNLYLRLTALQRLLAAQPALARLAGDAAEQGGVGEDALIAAARLDLRVHGSGERRRADYDPGEFRASLAAG